MIEAWQLRLRTAEALLRLVQARLVLALQPFSRWSQNVGLDGAASSNDRADAVRLARHVERATDRLPFSAKCLPRAIALSRMLLRRAISHRLIIATRPAEERTGIDDLHAWVEVGETIVIGQLPGPWLRVKAIPPD